MIFKIFAFGFFIFLGIISNKVNAFKIEVDGNKFDYPSARRDESVVENIHGKKVQKSKKSQTKKEKII